MSFDDFKAVYPRRGKHAMGWHKAEKIFATLVKGGENEQDIIAGAEGYAKTRVGEDPQMTQMATTFLNGRYWREFIPTPEELDDARKAKAEAMRAMASAVKRGENLAFINGDTLNELIECGLISREEAQRAGYKVA